MYKKQANEWTVQSILPFTSRSKGKLRHSLDVLMLTGREAYISAKQQSFSKLVELENLRGRATYTILAPRATLDQIVKPGMLVDLNHRLTHGVCSWHDLGGSKPLILVNPPSPLVGILRGDESNTLSGMASKVSSRKDLIVCKMKKKIEVIGAALKHGNEQWKQHN